MSDDVLRACIICGYTATPDDALVPTDSGKCICLPCWFRETGTGQPMPRKLRKELTAALDSVFASDWWDKA